MREDQEVMVYRSCGVASTRFEKGPERLGRRATEGSNEGEMNVRNEIISEETCLLCTVTRQPNTNILSIVKIVTYRYM